MLRGAVKEHEQKNGQSRLSQSSFASSQVAPAKPTYGSAANPGYRNPLMPSSSSAINSQNYQTHRGGLKRTASGLAKAFDGSFEEDGSGSRSQPIEIAAADDLFGEHDFDSDIDLDIEEPLPMAAVKYPKLPAFNTSKAVTYPSLPKEQPVRSFRGTTPGRDCMQPPAKSEAPDSSAPAPWSSSPVEHFKAARPQQSLQQYAFNIRPGNDIPSNAIPNEATQPPPAKRRNLPWLGDKAEPSPSIVPRKARTQNIPGMFTPLSKDKSKDKSMFPWNTTASAIKEQQKKHREESKKSVKKQAGTDESIAAAKSNNKRPARVFLSEEQQHVLDLVIEQKKSVFFTGSAGTGKSVLMREIISQLRRKYSREPDRVAVTASTGLAACNVGGVTLHSFAGIGLGKEAVPELVRKIKKNQKAKHRWMRTKVLVMDEVSMVDGELFDKLESIARQIRNNMRPFGGIQLVITGDFFQLPPVPEGGRVAKFAFDAATWSTSIEHTIGLHHVFRQKDPIFAGMLNEMREGRLSDSSTAAFRKLARPLTFEDMLDATELFPTRQEVERANAERLRGLQGENFPFPAKDGGSITDKNGRDRLLSNCLAPELITLKKGAQVMLIKNIDETLVNGSLGRVIGFMDERQFDSYNNNENLFPHSPGGTISHKTSDCGAGMDAGDRSRIMMDHITTSRKWPLVRFAIADGTWRDLLCQPESWKVELPNGEVQASRSQIPLILAWALSIHKAQGQTLERVKVDLGKVFEKGQAYVALSRATSMAGLQVLRFDPKKVNAHEKVRTFYANLGRVELAEKNKDRMEKISKSTTATAIDYEQTFVGGELDQY